MSMMPIKLGVRWPDYDLAIDRGTIRHFVEAIEELGYDHVTVMDHVAGVKELPPERKNHFKVDMEWGESLSMLTFMTGLSETLGFLTAVLVLPSRQTLLVAKQIATIDRLTEGRFRLGVSVGWNDVEFAALGANFHDRGRRIEEQIEVLRALWTERQISFQGEWHRFREVGISPRPIQQPIPIWLGMGYDPPPSVLRRAARLADGILPPWPPGEKARGFIEQILAEARNLGRDPSAIGLEGRINLRQGYGQGSRLAPMKDDDELATQLKDWADLGATHIEFKTRAAGLTSIDEHIAAMQRFKVLADSVLGSSS